jgi:predicted nuclease of predicted toxin-antitoxin system
MKTFPAMRSLRYVPQGRTYFGSGPKAPGITDQDVLARSLKDARVLLTFDKDFGELAWRSGLPASCGIVLFRLPALGPMGVGKVIADVLMARDDWPGHFSVVEPSRIRMRVLPPGSSGGPENRQ